MGKLLPVVILIAFCACNEAPIKYYTSVKVFKEFDQSRKFDTTVADARMKYHPVKIDLFYPSEDTPVSDPLTYGAFLDMYGERMDYFASREARSQLSLDIAKSIADYLKLDSAQQLLNYRTSIYEGLKLPENRLPLIIYAAGMNGGSWENVVLFDSLTKAGFLVAAVSSVGLFPGYMSSAEDLDEQVRDIIFAKNKLASMKFVDTSRIGLMSWSMGGSATGKAAMLDRAFKCLLSFDGTEIHYYGFDKAWDKDFDKIMTIEPFSPGMINIPYLYLSGQHPVKYDSVYNILKFVASKDLYFFKFRKGIHEDFSSMVTIAKQVDPRLKDFDEGRHSLVCKTATMFFDEHLNGKKGETAKKYLSDLIARHPALYTDSLP